MCNSFPTQKQLQSLFLISYSVFCRYTSCAVKTLGACRNMYLDVCRILVGFISCCLQFLADPSLDLVHVPAELLQRLRLTQLRTFLDHLGLQSAPPENIHI